jgi:hypothetical protein
MSSVTTYLSFTVSAAAHGANTNARKISPARKSCMPHSTIPVSTHKVRSSLVLSAEAFLIFTKASPHAKHSLKKAFQTRKGRPATGRPSL